MSEHTSFIERALGGHIVDVEEEIDDAIGEWHARGGHDDTGASVPLHGWLGMTREEYQLFLEQPRTLSAILHVRAYGGNLGDVVNAHDEREVRMAARGASDQDVATVMTWLRATHRIR